MPAVSVIAPVYSVAGCGWKLLVFPLASVSVTGVPSTNIRTPSSASRRKFSVRSAGSSIVRVNFAEKLSPGFAGGQFAMNGPL